MASLLAANDAPVDPAQQVRPLAAGTKWRLSERLIGLTNHNILGKFRFL
jgi:hypothetical protein